MAAAHDGEAGLVLLHGAELGAWIWQPTVEHLRSRALPVDLPGRDSPAKRRRDLRLDDAVDDAADKVGQWAVDRLILVAHSFSGVLVPGLTERLGGRVAGLVWIGATVPVEGRSWVDLQPRSQRLVLRLLYRLRPDGLLSPAKQTLSGLCNDLDSATAAEVVFRRVPEAPGFLLDAVRRPVPTGVVSHYVRLLRDRAQSEPERERCIARLPSAVVHDLDAGHLPMLSRPGALAALLDAVAGSPDHAEEATD